MVARVSPQFSLSTTWPRETCRLPDHQESRQEHRQKVSIYNSTVIRIVTLFSRLYCSDASQDDTARLKEVA
jgi:hypothetical protein